MVIWTSEIETENNVQFKDMGKRSWKWQLSIGLSHISLDKMYMSEKYPKWGYTLSYMDFRFRPFYWKFGSDSYYYDAHHYVISFGPFHFGWSD